MAPVLLFRHDPGGCDIALPVIDLLDQQGLAFGVKAPPDGPVVL